MIRGHILLLTTLQTEINCQLCLQFDLKPIQIPQHLNLLSVQCLQVLLRFTNLRAFNNYRSAGLLDRCRLGLMVTATLAL